ERIDRGAFQAVLDAHPDVALLSGHDMGDPTSLLARTTNRTLDLSEDPKGLRVYATIAPTTRGGDLRTLIERGDITGMSFGFTVGDDEWTQEGGQTVRTIKSFASLIEVSIVSFPAYPSTDVSVRELAPNLLVDHRVDLILYDALTG